MAYEKEYFDNASTKEPQQMKAYLEFLEGFGVEISGQRVLDIGCATGNFIELIKDKCECYGIDTSEYAISKCKEKFPEISDRFSTMDIEQEYSLEQRFDIITMFDVIEHLSEFNNINKLVKNNLSENGAFVITTPNANSLTRLLGSKDFTGEIDKTHKMLFTPYTLDFFS